MKRFFFIVIIAVMEILSPLDSIYGQTSKVPPLLQSLVKYYANKKFGSMSKRLPTPMSGGAIMTEVTALAGLVKERSTGPAISLLLKIKGSKKNIEKKGFKIDAMLGDIATADVPIEKIEELDQIDEVQAIEVSMPLTVSSLDQSSLKIRAAQARSTFNKTGDGTIVAVIDPTGIDLSHDDFRKADGTTRIKYLWDQTDMIGPSPADEIGTEWNEANINNAPGVTPCREKATSEHGTVVTGIAAGNGRATGNGKPSGTYVGIAPEADILFVKTGYYASDVIKALWWIGDKAAALNKPWVANLSLGTNIGPHDGTSLFEQAIFAVTNQPDIGKGRIIVVSAGNFGYDPNKGGNNQFIKGHAGGTPTRVAGLIVNAGDDPYPSKDQSEYIYIQIWYPKDKNIGVRINSPNGHTYGKDIDGFHYPCNKGEGNAEPGLGICYPANTDGLVSIQNEHFKPDYKKDNYFYTESNLCEIYIQDLDINDDKISDYDIKSGRWTIEITGDAGARWDAYLAFVGNENNIASRNAYFEDGSYENARNLAEPGNANNTITVGSYNSKNSWIDVNGYSRPPSSIQAWYPVDQISYFSSRGPTRDGRNKPELFAPGAYISSSLPDDISVLTGDQYRISSDGKHINSTGTSCAAPHVTGTIALLLQQNPEYTYSQILDILNRSKTVNGYLDVYTALQLNAPPTGVEASIAINEGGTNPLFQGSNASYTCSYYDNGDGSFLIRRDWNLKVFHTDGDYTLASYSSTFSNSWSFTVPNLPSGYKWERNQDGFVDAEITVFGLDDDGYWHTAKKRVGISLAPTPPIIYNTIAGLNQISLSFVGGGTKKVFYNTTSGAPYNGQGAVEGSSPIDVGNASTFTLHGLQSGVAYYVTVKSYNNEGASEYAIENVCKTVTSTISTNTTLSGNYIFEGNVTVSGGATLMLDPTCEVRFANASLIINNGATVTISGSNLYDIQSIIVQSGGLLTLNCNATLKFKSATDVYSESAPKGYLYVNGKIHADCASFTSSCTDPSYYWAAIYITNSNPGGDGNYIRNCTISQSKYGMTIYGSALNEITDNTITYCLNPIRLTGGSNVSQISSNHLYDNLEDGIVIYQSSVTNVYNNTIDKSLSTYSGRDGIWICSPNNQPLLTNNTITYGSQDGVRCQYYAAPNFGGPYGETYTPGWNKITNNARYGVNADYLAQPFLGEAVQSVCQISGGYNTIKWNGDKQLYVYDYDQVVYASWNYWGVDPDDGGYGFTEGTLYNLFGNLYPIVAPAQFEWDYHPSIAVFDPRFKELRSSSLSVKPNVADNSNGFTPMPIEGTPVSRERILLTLADQLKMARLYDKAIEAYENLIESYPTSGEARAALLRIHLTTQHYNDAVKDKKIIGKMKDRFQYFKLLASQKANTSLELGSLELAVLNAAMQGEIRQAITINRQIANRWPNSDHEKHALASLAELYWKLGENENARLNLAGLQSRYPGDPVTQLIADMGYMVEHFPQGDLSGQKSTANGSIWLENMHQQKISDRNTDLQPAETGLSANYPNPFNPSTTIVYGVSKPGMVRLFVFDMLGRKVVELVNEYQSEGEHRVYFNGTMLPSGVYFARLDFEGKQFNRRLMLMK
jgi:parallel beta-helix repeat protein